MRKSAAHFLLPILVLAISSCPRSEPVERAASPTDRNVETTALSDQPAEATAEGIPPGAEEIPPPSAPGRARSLLLSFAGDLMAHTPTFEMSDYAQIYDGLGNLLLTDDLSFVNLETPADPQVPYSTYPRFNVHPEFVGAAVEAGVDVFALANNHTVDQGKDGALRTLETLDALALERAAAGSTVVSIPGPGAPETETPVLHYSGIRRSGDEPISVTEIRTDGWRIGFVSVTHFSNEYRGTEVVNLVPFWDAEAEAEFVGFVAANAPGYDLFIVAYHGGDEYVLEPPARVRSFIDRIHAAGADIVWGHHAHVVQPWEIRMDPGTDEAVGILMPSMGNFVSGQTWLLGPDDAGTARAYTGDSVVLRVRVRMDERTGRVVFDFPHAVLITTYNGGGGTRIRLLDELAGEAAGSWGRYFSARLRAMRGLLEGLLSPPAGFYGGTRNRIGIYE